MYEVKRIWLKEDPLSYQQWVALMLSGGLNPDEPVDYTVGLYHQQELIATGSFQKNIIKCLVVDEAYQAENLLNQLVSILLEVLRERGFYHHLIYTKPQHQDVFQGLGFKKIIATKEILFMEQGVPDFASYLAMLQTQRQVGDGIGIVMNANPFTKGHQYLITEAAKTQRPVYVFVLTEDRSHFSSQARLQMVKEGTQHLHNVTVLPTEDYLVSTATFPSYFLKERVPIEIVKAQATFDAELFKESIAPALGITQRFVGEEPFSPITALYNQAMAEVFGEKLQLTVLPRLAIEGDVVSATKVRQALLEKNYQLLCEFLPVSTINYLKKDSENRGEGNWKCNKLALQEH